MSDIWGDRRWGKRFFFQSAMPNIAMLCRCLI
jgi:hypothetical protein